MKAISSPVTIAQAADLACVTERHLRRLIAAGTGPARRADGDLDCLVLGQWLARRNGGDGERLDVEQERARLARQQRLESEQRVRVRTAELVDRTVVERYVITVIQTLVHGLSSWPGRLAPALHACDDVAAVARALDAAVFDIRNDLCDAQERAFAAFREGTES